MYIGEEGLRLSLALKDSFRDKGICVDQN